MNKTRAGIYVRVSTEKQVDEGISICGQIDTLTEYAKKHNYQTFNYIDEGISGKTTKRDAFLQLIEDIKQHKIDVVLTWKTSRLGRDLFDLLYFSKILKENNVEIISFSEGYDINSATGRLVMNILGAIAQYQLEEYSENIKMVFDAKAKRGGRMCHLVLGYDLLGSDSYLKNQEEAKIVLKIFQTYNQVENLTKTSEIINSLGYRGKNGSKFSPEAIRQILKRVLYCGYIERGNELYKGNFDPIIDIDCYNKTQIKLYNNGRKSNKLFIVQNGKKVSVSSIVDELS